MGSLIAWFIVRFPDGRGWERAAESPEQFDLALGDAHLGVDQARPVGDQAALAVEQLEGIEGAGAIVAARQPVGVALLVEGTLEVGTPLALAGIQRQGTLDLAQGAEHRSVEARQGGVALCRCAVQAASRAFPVGEAPAQQRAGRVGQRAAAAEAGEGHCGGLGADGEADARVQLGFGQRAPGVGGGEPALGRADVRAARQQAPAVAGGQGTAQLRYAGAGRGRSVQLARRAPAEQRQFVECRAPPRLEHRQRGAGPLAQGQQPASLQLAGKAGGELAFAQRQARVEQADRSALHLCPSRQGAGADVGEGGLAGHADPEQVARRLRRFGIRLRRGDAGADFAPQVQLVGQVEAGGVFPLAVQVLVGGFGEGLVVAVAPILVAIADLGPWPAFALCAAQMAEERAGMGIGCGQVAVVAQRGGHQVVQPRVLVERPPLGGQRVAAGSRHPRQARVEAFRAWRGLVAVRAAQRGGDPQRQRHATQMTGKRHCPAPVSERAGNDKAGAGGLRRQKRQ